MSKLRSAKSKNIHEVVSFILSTALLSACSVGLDESSRVSGSGSGFDQFGRESSAEDAFSDQEITGGPAGPGGAFRSSAGTSSESQDGASSSDDPSSDAAAKSGDGAGSGDGTDTAQDAAAADTTASDTTSTAAAAAAAAVDTTSTATADATAAAADGTSGTDSTSGPACPGDDSNAIVKIHVIRATVGALKVLKNIGYETCGGSSINWLQGGASEPDASITLANGVKSFKEARSAVGVESYIVGFGLFKDKDGNPYEETSPLVIPASGVTSSDQHTCTSPATSMVSGGINSDGSIKRFCLVANEGVCDCTEVPPATSSTPSTPSTSETISTGTSFRSLDTGALSLPSK